jgi:hypothetical protein
LLALGHILLRRSGGSDVLVDAFEQVIGRVANGPGAHGKALSLVDFVREQDQELVFAGEILVLEGGAGRIGTGTPFDVDNFKVSGIEGNGVQFLQGGHPKAVYGFDPVVEEVEVYVQVLQAYGQVSEIISKVFIFFVGQVGSSCLQTTKSGHG